MNKELRSLVFGIMGAIGTFALIEFIAWSFIDPSICKSDKICFESAWALRIFCAITPILAIIMGLHIVGIFDELKGKITGSTKRAIDNSHGTMPKGYDRPNNREVKE